MPSAARESELNRIARDLRPLGSAYVPLLGIAARLGIKVSLRVHSGTGRRDAEIDLSSQPARILIYRQGNVNGERLLRESDERLLTARERFSVAHEIGHWVSYDRLKVKCSTTDCNYWIHEASVNSFAAALLAPDWLVDTWLQEVPEGEPVSPFSLRKWARQDCKTSEEVIARSLSQKRSSIGFIKVSFGQRKRDGEQILRALFSASGTSLYLPKLHSHIVHQGLRAALGSQAAGIRTFSDCSLGKCAPQNMKIAWRQAGSSSKPAGEEQILNSPLPQAIYWLSVALEQSPTLLARPEQYQLPS